VAVKDKHTFAFLDLEDAHTERERELVLTERIGAFFQEIGNRLPVSVIAFSLKAAPQGRLRANQVAK
jgi:hypothetical protein